MEPKQGERDLDAENGTAFLRAYNEQDTAAMKEAWLQVGDDMAIAMRSTAINLGLHVEPELEARANEAEKRNRQRLKQLRRYRGVGRFSIFG